MGTYIYYEEGPQALYEERRGRNKNMSSKSRKKEIIQRCRRRFDSRSSKT